MRVELAGLSERFSAVAVTVIIEIVGSGPLWSPDAADVVARDTRLTDWCGLCVRISTDAPIH